MAFFTDKFLNARREDLLRHIYRFQYQLNGGTWYTGEINSKEVVGTNVVVFVNKLSDKEKMIKQNRNELVCRLLVK